MRREHMSCEMRCEWCGGIHPFEISLRKGKRYSDGSAKRPVAKHHTNSINRCPYCMKR